jgi:hypothetical protein
VNIQVAHNLFMHDTGKTSAYRRVELMAGTKAK